MHSTFLAPTHKLITGTRLARRGRRDIAFYDCRETCKDFGTRAPHAGSDPITSSLTPDKFAAGNLVAFYGRIPPCFCGIQTPHCSRGTQIRRCSHGTQILCSHGIQIPRCSHGIRIPRCSRGILHCCGTRIALAGGTGPCPGGSTSSQGC